MDVADDFYRFLNIKSPPQLRLTTKSAVIAALHESRDGPRFDIPARDFVAQWIDHPDQMKPLDDALRGSVDVLLALREATEAGKLTEAVRRRTDELMASLSMPATTPAGLDYGKDVKAEYLAKFDSKNIPSIAIESAISEREWGRQAVGKVDRNTFIDKMHLISALPLVDEIVSNDKFFSAIYPVTRATGLVKANLILVADFLKRFELVQVQQNNPLMPAEIGGNSP